MRITATPQAVELVHRAGGRLYVWSVRSAGCQPMTYLRAATAPPARRTFHHATFEPFEPHLAATGSWPRELDLVSRRGHVQALWNGQAWAM